MQRPRSPRVVLPEPARRRLSRSSGPTDGGTNARAGTAPSQSTELLPHTSGSLVPSESPLPRANSTKHESRQRGARHLAGAPRAEVRAPCLKAPAFDDDALAADPAGLAGPAVDPQARRRVPTARR